MDERRFDDLTRTVSGTSRRGVLKTVAGGLLAGTLGVLGVTAASAGQCGRTGDKCMGNPDCCEKFTCVKSGGRGGRCRRDSSPSVPPLPRP